MSVIPCGIAIIRRGREFLISQRCEQDSFGSFWEFPGGKKNDDEGFEECVVREAREELGIEVSVEKKFLEISRDYKDKTIWLNFYLCSFVSGEPRALECQNFEWVDVRNLTKYKFPPANDLVIRQLERLYGQENQELS